jgi:Heterokaryon incompatibility protein (HET)
MALCRKIGVRYLWVDALCILQGNKEEKVKQIAQMDAIYSRALATIVCAFGQDSNSGIPGLSGPKRQLVQFLETFDGQKLTSSLSSTTGSARRSIWNTKAWTCQEYILSKRLLVFTDTYIFFRSRQGLWRDDIAISAAWALSSAWALSTVQIGSDDKWIEFNLNNLVDKEPKVVWEEYYNTLLTFYLRRQMKHDVDTLPAFSGIMKVLSGKLASGAAFQRLSLANRFFGRIRTGASLNGDLNSRVGLGRDGNGNSTTATMKEFLLERMIIIYLRERFLSRSTNLTKKGISAHFSTGRYPIG